MYDVPGVYEVLVDSLVMDDGPHHHMDVPDGVGQRDHAVWFEEKDTK